MVENFGEARSQGGGAGSGGKSGNKWTVAGEVEKWAACNMAAAVKRNQTK